MKHTDFKESATIQASTVSPLHPFSFATWDPPPQCVRQQNRILPEIRIELGILTRVVAHLCQLIMNSQELHLEVLDADF